MNDTNNQQPEGSLNSAQNISYAIRRSNRNQNAALPQENLSLLRAEEDQEQIVTSTSSDTYINTSGHLPSLEALITSPARITSSTGNDCSSSPQRLLSTTCSSSNSSGGSGRPSTQNRGDITTTDASSEDESQSPHQTTTQSSFVGRNVLKIGSAGRIFTRSAHILDSVMPTTSAAASTRTAGARKVEAELRTAAIVASNIHTNSSSISNLSNGGLEYMQEVGGSTRNMVAREQTAAVASSGDARADHVENVGTSGGQAQTAHVEQTTESHKIILKLPKPNASARLNESQSNTELITSDSVGGSSHSGVATTRKVEPLKINLHTHNPTNIVPKITIKPIMKKQNETTSSDCSSSAEDDTATALCSTRSGAQIPKRNDEPHIVPKLTIRSANDSSDSSIVPRLTIKMSDGQVSQLSPSTMQATSTAKQHSPPPLPKLTIKTSLDGISESIMSTISPASSSSSSSSRSSSVGVLCMSSGLSVSNATNASSVPKLTIRTLAAKHEELVPKLTIKTNAAGACIASSTKVAAAEHNVEVNDSGNIASSSSKIPKLTIKTGQEHAVIITQHNDSSNAQVIPKLTIKTKSLEVEESLSDLSEDPIPPPEKIPRITIKTHETAQDATAPKFCIKTLQQQSEPDHTHIIPKLTISMSNLEGGVAPQSPKQPPLVVRQVSISTHKPESPERLPKLMISRQDTLVNTSDASAEKTVPKLTIKTNSQDNSGGKECQEKIPKLTIKSIPNVEQHSSEESDECLSGESSPPMSDAEKRAANKLVPKLTIKNLSSPILKMKAVLEDKTQRNASKKCGRSSDPKGIGDTDVGKAISVLRQQQLGPQQSIDLSTRDQMINGCESSSSQEFCGFNNDNNSVVQQEEDEEVEDIQEPRRNSDDMDIDEGLQQHDPQVFNNVFHVSNGQNVDDTEPPLPAEDLSNVVDTVDLTSSPSPGSSPAHFNYTDADPQISDAQRPPQATILMERLQREMTVIQTAPPVENTNSFLLNQLNSPLANKYGGPPPLQPKPPQQQQHSNHEQQQLQKQQQEQQQQISNSIKYPQLTERLMANGARARRNSTITLTSNTLAPMNNTNSSVNMVSQANQPEKVIDSIEILDTPEGSPRLTLSDTAAMPDDLHINNEDGLNNAPGSGVYEENSDDVLRRNNNTMEDSSVAGESINSVSLKRHARAMSTLIMDNEVADQCIEITPNKVRRIDSESHTMATLTILTDDESSNTKLITTSPTIFGGNHHVVDITNDAASSDNVPITMDLSSPKTSNHHSRKQRHENLLTIPLDEENSLQCMNDDETANNTSTARNVQSVATKVAASAPLSDQLATSTPVVKRRGRPKKNASNNVATPAVVQTATTEADTAIGTADEVARRVELLRKRLAIDMVATEPPADELESTDVVNDSEALKSERALRTGARSSRRSVLPVASITPIAKAKPTVNNGEIAMKKSKRPVSTLGTGDTVAICGNAITTNAISSMPDGAVSVLNHCGGSNSSLSSAYSSSSMSSATVTTATGSQPSTSVSAPISLATQIDLTMCSSSSSASNGSATATMTIAGGSALVTTGAINIAVQSQSSSSMLPPATILSSSDPVPDVVFRPNDFSSLMATQQLRAPQVNINIETDILRMQSSFNSNKLDGQDVEYASESVGANGSGTDISGDESTNSLSTPVGRGRGGRGRGRGSSRGSARGNRAHRLGRGASSVAKQIALTRPRCIGGLKHTPDPERMKGLFSPSPQVFEEDTRMSADLSQTQLQLPTEPATPLRQPDFLNNDESQSSVVSTNSILDPNTMVSVQAASAVKRPKKKKMEVCVAEDAEITVSAIAEYEWPPPKGCCPARDRDTFMIQEQVALYLGIKSFKRKYPDLPRRQIDMEERNWLQEKGLVSERMCDLGITAVWASDILDIMYADFYEKYEEYKDFIRQKHLREIEAKQKALGLNVTGRGLQMRDRALLSTSKWNAYFNRSRKEERLACLDLQTLTVNVPVPTTAPKATLVNRPIAEAVAEAIKAEQIPAPPTLLQPRITTPPHNLDASYPVAVLPGQYSAKYHHYTSFELSCLPLDSVLIDPRLLAKRMTQETGLVESKILDEKPLLDQQSTEDIKQIENSKRRTRRARNATTTQTKFELAHDSETESAMSSSDSESGSETDSDSDTDNSSGTITSSSEEEGESPATCGVCQRAQNCNMKDLPEVFIRCYTCRRKVHPSCIEMPHRMVARVRNYNWQCCDCKCCIKCKGKKDQNKMLYCEQCDRGFHIYCLGIKAVPDGRWSCDRCSICMRCGATRPDGLPQPTNLISSNGEKIKPIKHKKVKWIHEYRIDHITKLREHCSMLCVPCGRAKNVRRIQVANQCVTNISTVSNPPSSPATTQPKQPPKSLPQVNNPATAGTNSASAVGDTATSTADGTARSNGKSSKSAPAANATKKSSTAGTLPPPPPPVVA